MKMHALSFLVSVVVVGMTLAQADTDNSIQKIREYKNRMDIPDKSPPSLDIKTMKVGQLGKTDKLNGKVMQIVNEKRCLVGIEPTTSGDGTYEVWVAVNCPTNGLKEGQKFAAKEWDSVVGGAVIQVIGTTTYNTVVGGMKTVFICRPIPKPTPDELAKGSGKKGAAAYDGFEEPLRSELVKAWQGELRAYENAIKDDKVRLVKATTQQERAKCQRYITEYTEKARRHELNSPPYFSPEHQKVIKNLR